MPTAWEGVQNDPSRVLMMIHESGVAVDEAVARLFSNRDEHDPSDLDDARRIAAREDVLPIGLFYRNESADRYDLNTVRRLGMSAEDKIKGLERELDRFLI
jgi:hypothetical protein